jgi:ubiquinone biosynthesis protein
MTDWPPLPDPLDLLDEATVFDDVPGLKQFARRWLAAAPRMRARVAEEALALAQPSFRPTSLAAAARTGARAARAAAPGLAAEMTRRALRTGPAERAEYLRHVQDVVKAGGSTFVKLGQFVATAQGLLPDEWVDAFGWCRDEVQPLAPGEAELRIEETFDAPVRLLFSTFDPKPLGAASIGQVHAATLHDGTDVVIKIRRPGLRERFVSDLRAMALAAAATERASEAARFANLPGFVELFAQLVLEEIDFRFEAINQLELSLAAHQAGQDYLRFPRPIPSLVTEDILVMERVPGVRYTDAVAAYPDVVDGARLLRLAVTGVLEHTLAYGVFHGDLHAGNVLISPSGDFSVIDFGIAGRVDATQRAALVQFLVGFGRNDTRLQLKALQMFGAIPEDADLDVVTAQLEAGLALLDPALLDRQTVVTVDQLSTLLGVIIRTLATNGFRLPKELVLFFKNLLYLNGFASTLAPDTNLLAEIEPIFGYFLARYPDQLAMIMSDVVSGNTTDA